MLKCALERKGTSMLYTELTTKAMKLAYKAHHGQFDRGGVPYVFHPFHLAEQMDTEAEICVALLHDVVEDTDYTIEQIRAEGFPEEVCNSVRLLTHDDDTEYMDYVKKLKQDKLARKVKLADLEHNSDASRATGEDPAVLAGRMEKYRKAKEILMDET